MTWKVSTKKCDQLHVFSLWRLTWVFDGTWKNFHKKVCPVTRFFAVESILGFWWDLKKFSQKSVPSYTFCSLWRLTWVFDGTWNNFHKKSVPSHTFLRCGEYLKFLRGLGKFRQKGVTSYTFFFRSADYLKFLMGLGKIFTKKCAQLHVLFAVETILSFGWDFKKFWQKGVTSYTFSQCRLS